MDKIRYGIIGCGSMGREHIENLRAMGGAVDYTVGPALIKVFVLAEHRDPKQRHYLNLYKMGEGPLYPFWTPYHLVHFECPSAIARVHIFKDELAPPLGAEVVAEVVISNRNAAHSFPPEVRDLYEAWVEFEAIDGTGKTLFHSGFLKPDGYLEEGAHVYKQIILDAQGRQITRHQIWTTTIRAYDNAIAPGRSNSD